MCCCYCCCCAAAAAEVNLVRAVAATAAMLLLRLVEWRTIFLQTKQRRTNNCTGTSLSKYQNLKNNLGCPSDLLVSGRRNAIPCQIEPAKRRLMRRAPPQSSAEIQTCFIMHPWQASLPRGRKCARRSTRPPESSEPKKMKIIFYIYIHARVCTCTSALRLLHLLCRITRHPAVSCHTHTTTIISWEL